MYLLTNGKLITRDPDHPYFEKGGVVFEGASIVEVGDEAALREKVDEVLEALKKHGLL